MQYFQLEIEKLVEEHKASLEEKKREFELEIEQKRKSLDDELKSKVVEVNQKEAEINHNEEKVAKREQALDKRLEKIKNKENDFESKVKLLKEKEKNIKLEGKSLEAEKKELLANKEDLLSLKAKIEKIRAENEEQMLKIQKEKDQLKITEEERAEFLRLQSELKEEIEKCRLQEELVLKEAEDLKQQKENFEKEWEELDEKRAEVEKELKKISEQKEKLEKERHNEEERLRNEKQAADDHVKRELEALEVAKETFKATMEHEQSTLAQKAESEKRQLFHDFELQKGKLETEMQNRREELEKDLREKEKRFEEEKERELSNLNYLRDLARKEMEEMKLERSKLEKEKQDIDAHRKHLEGEQVGIRKDIDMLVDLTKTLKNQREQLVKERDRFLSFVEKNKSCRNCAELISEFAISDLVQEIGKAEVPQLPSLANDYVSERKSTEISPFVFGSGSPKSAGSMSWLKKCTSKIFKFSPIKKEHTVGQELLREAPMSGDLINIGESSKRLSSTGNEPEFGVQYDTSTRQVEGNRSNSNGKGQEVPEDSGAADENQARQPQKRARPRVSRTRSVKAVVQDAKTILGEGLETSETEHPNGNAEDSANVKAESSSLVADKGTKRNVRKRNRAQTSQVSLSEHDVDDSEGQSDSVQASQQKKRRQKAAPAGQTQGGARYNLRRPRT